MKTPFAFFPAWLSELTVSVTGDTMSALLVTSPLHGVLPFFLTDASFKRANYTDPFDNSNAIICECAYACSVSLKINDVRGCEPGIPVNSYHQPGKYKVVWNPPSAVSGACLRAFRINGKTLSIKKMLLLK